MKEIRDRLRKELNDKNIGLRTKKKLIEESTRLFETNLGLELDLITDDEGKQLLLIKLTSFRDKSSEKTVYKIGLEISNNGAFKRKF